MAAFVTSKGCLVPCTQVSLARQSLAYFSVTFNFILVLEADNTTADVLLCDESTPSIHEIDVVVHPSLLQPTENCENMKKIERQKGTGNL